MCTKKNYTCNKNNHRCECDFAVNKCCINDVLCTQDQICNIEKHQCVSCNAPNCCNNFVNFPENLTCIDNKCVCDRSNNRCCADSDCPTAYICENKKCTCDPSKGTTYHVCRNNTWECISGLGGAQNAALQMPIVGVIPVSALREDYSSAWGSNWLLPI